MAGKAARDGVNLAAHAFVVRASAAPDPILHSPPKDRSR